MNRDREERIKDVKQPKETANIRQAVVTVMPDEQITDQGTTPSPNLSTGLRRKRRPIKRTIKVKA